MRPIRLSLQYFGSYTAQQTIDFDLLGTKGLYLITGDTGSGKTTLFDAILFALYGSMSGEYRSKDTSVLRSSMAQETDKTEVELVFEFNNIQYTVTRWMEYMQPKKRGEGLTKAVSGATLTWTGCTAPISKATDVDAKILEILGINRDQFSQIAMIAQGDFMKLLMNDTKDRLELFRKIFRTENYKALQERIAKEFKEIESRLNEAHVSVNTIIGMVQCADDSALRVMLDQAKDGKVFTPVSSMIDIIMQIHEEDKITLAELNRQREEQQAVVSVCKQHIGIIDSHAKSAEQLPGEQAKLKNLTEVQRPAREQAKKQAEEALPRINSLNEQAMRMEGNIGDYQAMTEWKSKFNTATQTLEAINGPQGRKAKNEQAFIELENERKRLQEEQASLGNPEAEQTDLRTKLAALTQYQLDLSALSTQRSALKAGQTIFKTLDANAMLAEGELSRKTTLFYAAQAGILAETLVEGKPCPVCGSIHHPVKAQKAEEVPTEDELKRLEKEAQESRKKANEQAAYCSGLIIAIQTEEKRLTGLGRSTDEAELVTLPSRISELKSQIDALTVKLNRVKAIPGLLAQLETKRQTLETEQRTIIADESKATKDIETAKTRIAELQKRCTYTDENAARKAINTLRQEAGELQKAIEQATRLLQQVDNEIAATAATIKTIEKNLETVVTLNREVESEKMQAAQQAIDAITPLINIVTGRNSNNGNALLQLQDKAAQLEQIEKHYQWLKTLNDTVQGQLSGKEKIMLETYILAAYFERIIRKANLRLLKMTNNQYELRRKRDAVNNRQQTGLDLDIVDHHNGKIRTVKSLSGGESFMASLSLALGLSDEIQSSCGGIHLDTMFVDEGFGSLDEESRILARNTLQRLSQEGNRLIGVISHVPELKTIDRQIQVRKDHHGVSSAEVVIL